MRPSSDRWCPTVRHWHLVACLGYKRAYQALIEGRKIPAAECSLWAGQSGHQVRRLRSGSARVFEGLAERAPLALRYSKATARVPCAATLDACIRDEAALQNITIASPGRAPRRCGFLPEACAGL